MTNTTDIPVAVAYFKVRIPGFSLLGPGDGNGEETDVGTLVKSYARLLGYLRLDTK